MNQPLAEVRCCVDVPPSFDRKARYALEMLLRPLGIQPLWVGKQDLGDQGVYYGIEQARQSDAVLMLAYSEDAARYYERRVAFAADAVTWTDWDGETWPVLFRSGSSGLPDVVASAFYWLAGWQEHTIHERDEHGRFPFRASLQCRLGTALRPAVDAYRMLLREWLCAAGIPVRTATWDGKAWAFCPTIDIDYARKWRLRRLVGELARSFQGGAGRESIRMRLRNVAEALRERTGGADPYVVAIKRIVDEIVAREGAATIFLKAGAYGPHDVPYSLSDPALRDRLDEIVGAGFEIGLHPGFHAHTHLGHLRAERERVVSIVPGMLTSVRQHYIRYDPNVTPRLQHAAGFTIDSTLGFSEQEGFRNGTCLPFRLFDAVADEPLPLWEMPVAAMDAALFNRRMLDVDAAVQATTELMTAARRFRGACVVIWHNLLWDERDHSGWGEHFTRTLDVAVEGGAYMGSLQDALRAWA